MAKPKSEGLAFSFDSVDKVHDEIQESSPEPTAAAVEARAASDEKQARESIAQSSTTDSEGTPFNPEQHAVDKDGNPSVTPKGKFRKRRGASKVATQSDAAQKVADEQAARAAGQLAADMMIGSAVTLLGEEWIPIGADGKQEPMKFNEHENLRRAFGDYFAARGISDFPPGIMLSIAVSSYAAPRLAAGKETQTRLAKVKIWAADKLNNMKRKRKNGAQSASRDDGKRENNASKNAMPNESPEATRHART